MEVHHHPDVEKKGFKEYLLEGLMIFIAVTMGFFAESIREHLSDRSKEHEYIISIKKDLITDTANLDVWIPSMGLRAAYYDSLIMCLQTGGPVKNGGDMYFYARIATRASNYEPSDNTVLEMKSSGNLRLVHDRTIVNGLVELDRAFGHYKSLVDVDEREDMMLYPLLGDLFDASIFNNMVKMKNMHATEKDYAAGQRSSTSRPAGNPQLRKYNKDEINMLIYCLHQRKSSFLGEIHDLTAQKYLATSLIARIDKVYKVQDE